MFDLRLWLESLLAPVALIAWCLMLLTATAWGTRMPKLMRLGAAGVLLVYLALSMPLTVDPVFSALQNWARRDARCGPPPAGSVIIVLAGGFEHPPDRLDDFNALQGDGLRRTLAAVALARRTPHSVLLFTGGGNTRLSEAAVMGAFAEALGIAKNRIELEQRSHTTYESAINTRAMLAHVQPTARYLVTSAYHMPRSYRAFRDAGQTVCAWPAGFLSTHAPLLDRLIPQLGGLEKSSLLLHEYFGMMYYSLVKFRQWSSAPPQT